MVVLLVTFAVLSVPASGVSADEIEFKCWAVFIGLSEYQQIDPSEGCAEAATGFYETISRIWGEEYCKLLTNDEATKNKIHKAINWLADNAGADDIVLIYYAGHGDPSGYLSTYNSYYTDTWIGTVEMNSWLHYIKSQKMIIVLDSCHSSPMNYPIYFQIRAAYSPFICWMQSTISSMLNVLWISTSQRKRYLR